MRYVSYVRDNPGKNRFMDEEQRKIDAWTKEHGVVLQKKYRDADDCVDGIRQLINDGVDRKYDRIILDSIYDFGENVGQADQTLRITFFPYGIYFICLDDGYTSEGKTEKELQAYFHEKRFAPQKERLKGYVSQGINVVPRTKKKVPQMPKKRRTAHRKNTSLMSVLLSITIDEKSGRRFEAVEREEGSYILHSKVRRKNVTSISYEKLVRAVYEKIKEEKLTAVCVSERMQDCNEEAEVQLAPLRKEALQLFWETEALVRRRQKIMESIKTDMSQPDETGQCENPEQYDKRQQCENPVRKTKEAADDLQQIEEALKDAEYRFEELVVQEKTIYKAFSKDNPWLKSYRDLEIPKVLTGDFLLDAVYRVLVKDDDTVEIITADDDYKDLLPREWMQP